MLRRPESIQCECHHMGIDPSVDPTLVKNASRGDLTLVLENVPL
jgi:hypothetical protein